MPTCPEVLSQPTTIDPGPAVAPGVRPRPAPVRIPRRQEPRRRMPKPDPFNPPEPGVLPGPKS